MSAPDRFEIVAPERAFGELAPVWEELLRASAADTPFLSPIWLEAWWSTYGAGAGREPLLVFGRRGREITGIVPLQLVGERWRGRIPLRTMRLFGDGTHDSDYLDFIVPRGEEEAFVPAFWSWLKSAAPRYEVALWNEIPAASPSGAALRQLATSEKALLDEERVGCVVASLPASYEAYVASLKPRMRTKVRSLRRDLVSEHGAALVRCDEAALESTLESLFRLHERRWATRGQAGVFGIPAKRAFYRTMARSFLRRGRLDLTTLVAAGIPVAHQCCVRHGNATFLLQEGYDPEWEDRGVGNALRAMTIETLIAEGVQTYDFLAGVTDHKLSWGGSVKESLRLTMRGRGAGATLASGLTKLASARARIRTVFGRSDR